MRKFYLVFVTLFLCVSCSSLESQKSRRDYESFVWSNFLETTLVSEGKNLANARILVLDDLYHQKKSEMLGAESPTSENKLVSQRMLLVALQIKSGTGFTKSDFKVLKDDKELVLVKEEANPLVIRSLYSFAYPFHRVFLFELDLQDQISGEIKIQTPWGLMKRSLK